MKRGQLADLAPAGFLTLTLTLPLLGAACGRQEKAPPSPSPPPPAPAAGAPAAGAPAAGAPAAEKIHVLTPDDQAAVSFLLSATEVRIVFFDGEEKRVLRSDRSQRRNRRYYERGRGPVVLVRSNPKYEAFTVRTLDGELRWRVWLGKKISIGDPPEKDAFELRQPQGNVVRAVTREGTDLGKVSFKFQRSQVKVRDPEGNLVYHGKIRHGSAMYGVLLVPGLDPVERYVLMAELFLRQR